MRGAADRLPARAAAARLPCCVMSGGDWQSWFERVWARREDEVYRGLFGDLGGGVHTATIVHFARLQQSPRHPGWLHHGVFGCPPHGGRDHWIYVTSGLSNPWNLDAPG